jgi:hypothetical protein
LRRHIPDSCERNRERLLKEERNKEGNTERNKIKEKNEEEVRVEEKNKDEVNEHNDVPIEVSECKKKLFTQRRKKRNGVNNIAFALEINCYFTCDLLLPLGNENKITVKISEMFFYISLFLEAKQHLIARDMKTFSYTDAYILYDTMIKNLFFHKANL